MTQAPSTGTTPGEAPRPAGWLGRNRGWLLFWGAWTFFFLLTAAHVYLVFGWRARLPNAPPPPPAGRVWLQAFAYAAIYVWPWAVMCLVAMRLARREGPAGIRLGRLIGSYLAAALAVILARNVALYWLLRGAPGVGARSFGEFVLFRSNFPVELLNAFLVIGWAYAIEYVRRLRDRDLRESRLEVELARAQLQTLKVQLQPHFLFNALHAISSLIYSDVRRADEMISNLGEMLRRSLLTMHVQEVTLREELEFLGPYLAIEKTRLGERLSVEVEVEPGLETASVPHMILQPLVENAIRHGIAPRRGGGELVVGARAREGRLVLIVSDDGPGMDGTDGSPHHGVGLSNTRARLAHLFGADYTLDLRSEGAGFTAEITFPLRHLRATQPATTHDHSHTAGG